MKQEKLTHNEMLNRILRHIETAQPRELIDVFKLFNKNIHVGYDFHNKQFTLNWGMKIGPRTGHTIKELS